jgi:hypothetical protein
MLRAAPASWDAVAEAAPDGWLLMAPIADMLLFNRIVGCGVSRPATEAGLRKQVGRLRQTGVKDFGVQLAPGAMPADIERWLAAEGLTARDRWTKVYREAGDIAPANTELRIESAGPEHAEVVADVTTKGFGMPPPFKPWIAELVLRPGWRFYLAWSGDEAVAAGALFVRDNVGWLGIGSTLPAARRRGAQGALMARRLIDGEGLGCKMFVTETGEETPERPNPSYRNMIRAGFTVAYHRPNYMAI